MGWNDYTVGAESCVIFAYNRAGLGGAIVLLDLSGTLIVDRNTNLTFSHNSASNGGAIAFQVLWNHG